MMEQQPVVAAVVAGSSASLSPFYLPSAEYFASFGLGK
jgi:hypothetical protein